MASTDKIEFSSLKTKCYPAGNKSACTDVLTHVLF